MIRFDDAKVALAQAIYDLLADSDAAQSFSVKEITKKANLTIKGAFASRILNLSREEDDTFDVFEDGGVEYWTLGKEGFDLIESSRIIETDQLSGEAPASDRVVQFNHNAPDALEISNQLSEIAENIRGINDPTIGEQERSRVYNALVIAKEIWDSGQFKLIQLKVGVLLAVEDATVLLSKVAKHVAAALLVDAIKAFAKNHFHADLDAL